MNVDNLMNILIFACGAYTVYSAVIMMKTGEIKKWLLGENVDIKKCRDVPGFINYISKKILIFGVIIVLFSIVGFINTYIAEIETQYMVSGTIALVIICIIFGVVYVKARKRFLD